MIPTDLQAQRVGRDVPTRLRSTSQVTGTTERLFEGKDLAPATAFPDASNRRTGGPPAERSRGSERVYATSETFRRPPGLRRRS
jgi:hypothetical protein